MHNYVRSQKNILSSCKTEKKSKYLYIHLWR